MISMIKLFVIGFYTTFKHMFKKANTVNYRPRVLVFRSIAAAVLMRTNGLEVRGVRFAPWRPADAITSSRPRTTARSAGRATSIYQIHKARCIFCGYCEEPAGFRDLHGQGLRAGGLQQRRLHLGQEIFGAGESNH